MQLKKSLLIADRRDMTTVMKTFYNQIRAKQNEIICGLKRT